MTSFLDCHYLRCIMYVAVIEKLNDRDYLSLIRLRNAYPLHLNLDGSWF